MPVPALVLYNNRYLPKIGLSDANVFRVDFLSFRHNFYGAIPDRPHEGRLEGYDFSFHPHLDKRTVMELFDLTFVENHENVIFLGPPGVGKTHLAISLAIKACHHGFKVYFTTMETLIRKIKEAGQSRHKAYLTSSLVVVDEVGYLAVNPQEAYLFFQFVSQRYEALDHHHLQQELRRLAGTLRRSGDCHGDS